MRSRRSLQSRPSRRRINRVLCQALESRILFSTFTVADSGNITTNGTNLKNVLNGITKDDTGSHTLQYGDTIILTAGATYYSHVSYTLSNLTAGTGTVTIESSALSSLPSGQRVGPSQASFMPKIASDSGTSIISTAKSNNSGTWVPVHDVAFLGLEIAPSAGTTSFNSGLLLLGDGSTSQDTTAEVPYNFTVDRCYIHGYDDLTNAFLTTNYKNGVSLDCNHATVENSYISDFHNTGNDCQAISGFNGMGNYTVTNNFLEATGENFFQGGADSHLGVGVDPNNITVSHNIMFKRLVWDPYDPSYLGVHMDVKNLFELKHATNVLVDSNLMENCWVGADQRGEAVAIGPKNQSGGNTWALMHDITLTNNVMKNIGEGIQIGSDTVSDAGYTTLPMYNVLIYNNLIESVDAGKWNGTGSGITVGGSFMAGSNITIDHNTIFNSGGALVIGSSAPFSPAVYGFTFTNNLVQEGVGTGIGGTPGEGVKSLDDFMSGIHITNAGAGYSSAPSVTFSGGGGSGAAGTALMAWNVGSATVSNGGSGYTSAPTVTLSGSPTPLGIDATAVAVLDGSGHVIGITITNPGTGYITAPTVTINNAGTGGSGATGTTTLGTAVVYNIQITNNGTGYTSSPTVTIAAPPTGGTQATVTSDVTNGQIGAWLVTNNVFFGNGVATGTTNYPAGNFISSATATEDMIGFKDPAGELPSLLSTSPFFTDGTGGSTPGANITAFAGITDYTPVDSTLTGYWKFDEGSGTTVSDSTGNGKTGTLTSSTLWTTTGQSLDALALTGGTSGSVSIPSFSTTSSFSFSAWVNPTNFSATQYIASATNSAFSLSINTSGKLVAAGKTGSVTASTAMTAGTWYLVGVTFNGTTLTAYQNGVAVGSVSATTATGSTTLYLGGNKGSVSSFNGSIDEARYYNSALTTTDLNGLNGMQRLYSNFSPTINVINPNGGSTMTTPTTVLGSTATDHAVGKGATNASPTPLSFSWSVYSYGPDAQHQTVGATGGATFSASNNSNAGQNTTVTWGSAGVYIIQLQVTDGHGGVDTVLHPLTVTGVGTPPATPTNIAATAGTNSITVSWTDNATNETSFDIQRYDANNGWVDLGNVASATGSGSTVSYTDTTAATDGTPYLYQVAAVNSNGPSNYDSLTCGVATVLAYEGFNYANVAAFNGGNTGLGFASGWTLGSSSHTGVVTGSLNFSSNGHALTTSANSVTLTNGVGSKSSITLANSVGTPGSVLWVGFEFSMTGTTNDAEVELGTTGNLIDMGAGPTGSGSLAVHAFVGSNGYQKTIQNGALSNTTYFMVFEINYATTGDVISLYLNPTPDSNPGDIAPTPNATLTLPASSQLSPATTLSINPLSSGTNVATFDEIRLGLSYAAVAPDPLVSSIADSHSYTPVIALQANTTPLLLQTIVPSTVTLTLAATPVPTATLDLSIHIAPSDYHLSDAATPADPTLDWAADLLDQLLLV